MEVLKITDLTVIEGDNEPETITKTVTLDALENFEMPEAPAVTAEFVKPDPVILLFIPTAGQAALSVAEAKELVSALVPAIAAAEADG